MSNCPLCGSPMLDDGRPCPFCTASPGSGVRGVGSLAALTEAARNGQTIFESRIFLFLTFLGLSPLVLATLPTSRLVVDALSVWTGLCWGILLFRLFAPPPLSLKVALAVLLGTSFLVMPLFEAFLRIIPPGLDKWLDSDNLLERLLGFVFNVGIREEAFKAIPVVITLWFVPRLRETRSGVVLGMMAGIGFAATENVYYVYSTLSDAFHQANSSDISALLMPVYNNLVRTMVGPFAHATFSGLFGAFAATGMARAAPSSLVSGLLIAASVHGAYDTVVGFSGPLGAATLGVSLFLAMAAHRGQPSADPLPSDADGLFSRTIVRTPSGPRALPPGLAPSPQPSPAWFIATPDDAVTPVPAAGAMRIGRDATVCGLTLVDPSVSRVHATIELRSGRPFLTREARSGLVLLNGTPIDVAEIRSGDEVRLGNTRLRITRGAASLRPA